MAAGMGVLMNVGDMCPYYVLQRSFVRLADWPVLSRLAVRQTGKHSYI